MQIHKNSSVYRYAACALLFWSLVVGLSLIWSLHEAESNRIDSLLAGGRAFFQQAVLTRAWNALHGGVFVKVDEHTQPNPYLKIPKREITDQDGVVYTKINPAFMTRQIAEIAEQRNGVKFHITSLKPLRPQNAPSLWEEKALKLFEAGQNEYRRWNRKDRLFHYMAPLKVVRTCLPCHRKQGYKIGDIRGGISVTFPVAAPGKQIPIYAGHLGVYLIGVIGILLGAILLSGSQKKVLEAKNRAETANRAKSDFLANMSHEIRTPMNGILNMIDLLLESELTSKQQDLLNIAKQSSNNLMGIINQILDFSKIEAGCLELESVNFEFRKAIDDVISTFTTLAAEKNLRLSRETDPEIPRYLVGDVLKFKQIIINLVGNAIKFTPSGEVRLRALLESRGKSQIQIHVIISDTGPGIPPEQCETIFQSFNQADSSITRKYGGTGLGLTICQQLIQLMEGRIWLESELNRGSDFHFTLPFGIGTLDPVESDQTTAIPQKRYYFVPGFRILLVDDNELNILVASMLLRKAGARIETAGHGREALEKLASEDNFNLVLMDMHMPEIDGLTATRIIRQAETGDKENTTGEVITSELFLRLRKRLTGRRLTIVAMTANVTTAMYQKCMDAGMDDYLAKPFRMGDLQETLLHLFKGTCFTQPEDAVEPSPDGEISGEHDSERQKISEHLQHNFGLTSPQIETILNSAGKLVQEFAARAGKAAKANELEQLSLISHKLKGTLLDLGMDKWAAKAQEIEQRAKQGDECNYSELVVELYLGVSFLIKETDSLKHE